MLIILSFASQGQSNIGSMSPSDTVSSGDGSHRQLEIEKLIKAVEQAKDQKPARYEYLKDLLSKPPFTTAEYKLPAILLYYKGNATTLTRNEPLDIYTNITNSNPVEIRRALYLYLEILDPGEKDYRQLNLVPEIIQTNEYNEENTTSRRWDVLPSFNYLKTCGQEKIRVSISDGVHKWYTTNYTRVNPPYYRELIFNVANMPPEIRNMTVTGPDLVRFTDPIVYEAETYDPEGDMLDITLHVLDDSGNPKMNLTQRVKGGNPAIFKAADYGLFTEQDAGKNFTYYYYVDDGISNNTTKMKKDLGPNLRYRPKLKVSEPEVRAENDNRYWWQKYYFTFKISNQEQGVEEVLVTLYTDTPARTKNYAGKKDIMVTEKPQIVTLEARPFNAKDAGNNFTFLLEFSEEVQGQEDKTIESPKAIMLNSRIIEFNPNSFIVILLFNIILIFLTPFVISIIIEWRRYR